MGLKVAPTTGGDYEIVPAETTLAVCITVADLGLQRQEWKGQERIRPQIAIVWELPKLRMEDGRPFVISKVYTASLSEKANLRKDLKAWRGKDLSEAELKETYDFKKLLGQWCSLSIAHTEKDGKTYANISSIAQLMKELMPVAKETEVYNEPICYDLDEPDEEAYGKLFGWIQDKITARVVDEEEWEKEANEALNQENSEEIPF